MNTIRANHIGEQRMANCGDIMTIIEWFHRGNITVMFADGGIAKNKHYEHFLEGKIMNPNRRNHVGETRKANCGMEMTVVAYRSGKDCDIQFKDGAMRCHVGYHNFLKGAIGYPEQKISHVGEKRMANNGMEMEIVEWFKRSQITVRFSDGTVRANCTYDNFLNGKIANPNLPSVNAFSFEESTFLFYLEKIGFKRCGKGYFKKFLSSWGNKELDMFNEQLMVGIEYDGAYWHGDSVVKDLEKDKLCYNSGIDLIRIRATDKGCELPILNSGMSYEVVVNPKSPESVEMAIIDILMYLNMKYEKTFSLDVDTIRDSQKIKNFYRGMIYEGNTSHIGEIATARNGQTMTLKEYFGWDDVTVEFEDGTIKTRVNYQNFLRGDVGNPNYFQKRVGEERIAGCGLKMKIIEYHSYKEVVVQFEDGYITTTIYQSFNHGHVGHPKFKNRKAA